MNPLSWIDDELGSLERRHLRRRPITHDGRQSAKLTIEGRELLNFGSNDYLGLSADRRLSEAVREAAARVGWGSGASPLVTGRSDLHRQLEQRLAEFEETESALLFSSGFAANIGAISSLVGQGDAVFCDRKNHASIWDGCRLSRADVRVYPHNDCRRLADLLEASGRYRRRLIVTDGLFSMDGDFAPLAELAELAERHGAMLMVDEAHATGVFGRNGRGAAEYLNVEHRVHVRVGTLSKALGCSGGFVSGSRSLIDWLANRARSYVFSTASPAAASAASIRALDIVREEPARRETLLGRAEKLRTELRERGWNTGASASQIVPIIVGEPQRALELSSRLFERGIFAPAIRPPTVPEGEAMLRISLTAAHTEEMVGSLLESLASNE